MSKRQYEQYKGLDFIYVGHNVEIADNAFLDPMNVTYIGDHSYIGGNVVIYRHRHRVDKYLWGYNAEYTEDAPLTIGSHVFIGRNVTILAQVTSIGDNVVIGLGSVVTHNIPANEIWAGNPARFIRKRNIVKGIDILAHDEHDDRN